MSNKDDNVDITHILKAIDNTDNENIMKYTRDSIKTMKEKILQELHFPENMYNTYLTKLTDFRYVDDLSDIKYGAYIRWINISNPEQLKLTNGGIVCDIQFFDSGVQLLCKNQYGRFYKVKVDSSIIFQKLSDQEQVILDVISYLNTDD